MESFFKLLMPIAALIAALSLAWIAFSGSRLELNVTIEHPGKSLEPAF
jgi:hypothetical protein